MTVVRCRRTRYKDCQFDRVEIDWTDLLRAIPPVHCKSHFIKGSPHVNAICDPVCQSDEVDHPERLAGPFEVRGTSAMNEEHNKFEKRDTRGQRS